MFFVKNVHLFLSLGSLVHHSSVGPGLNELKTIKICSKKIAKKALKKINFTAKMYCKIVF